VIIPKFEKLTTKGKKQQAILKIKSDLGALNAEEKEEIQQDLGIQMEFMQNPFFYADIEALIVDLNFKHYLHTSFNTILDPTGDIINSFQDIDNEIDEIFVASLDEDENNMESLKEIGKVLEDIKSKTGLYTNYRNVLEHESVSLKLENFAETNEFNQGSNGGFHQNSIISPIKRKKGDQKGGEIEVQDGDQKKMKFAKFLNRNPIRRHPKTQREALLPSLPHRFIVDKQTFKASPLRHVCNFINQNCSYLMMLIDFR
jgi:hypothetical protein